jgi:hypothetical protein
MNLKFVGDALDYWKGAIFADLNSEKLIENFRVDRMATDKWQPADLALFAHLLRIKESQLIFHEYDLRLERSQYFSEISPSGDLFLDPDTGIRTGAVRQPQQYLQPSELFGLLEANKNRLVVVYQHVRAKKTSARLEGVLSTLQRAKRSTFFCSSYEAPTVALLFFSQNRDRTKPVHDYFCRLLGSHAAHRVGFWNC